MPFTKKYHAPCGRGRDQGKRYTWLVLVGVEADRQYEVVSPGFPDERVIRIRFGIPDEEPVLIGRP